MWPPKVSIYDVCFKSKRPTILLGTTICLTKVSNNDVCIMLKIPTFFLEKNNMQNNRFVNIFPCCNFSLISYQSVVTSWRGILANVKYIEKWQSIPVALVFCINHYLSKMSRYFNDACAFKVGTFFWLFMYLHLISFKK